MFRLRNDAKKWFQDLRPTLKLDFDVYYLCLMAGLVTGRKNEGLSSESTDTVNYFPGDYQTTGPIIVSLFLSRELKQLGVKLTERNALHSAISPLIEPRAPSMLSDQGMKEMNKYAFEGLDVLQEWFGDRPRTIESFLPVYKRKLDNETRRSTS